MSVQESQICALPPPPTHTADDGHILHKRSLSQIAADVSGDK